MFILRKTCLSKRLITPKVYKDTATIFLKFSYINIVLNWLLLHISGYILKKMNIYGINNYFLQILGISERSIMSKKKEILTRVLAKKKPGSNSISPVKLG